MHSKSVIQQYQEYLHKDILYITKALDTKEKAGEPVDEETLYQIGSVLDRISLWYPDIEGETKARAFYLARKIQRVSPPSERMEKAIDSFLQKVHADNAEKHVEGSFSDEALLTFSNIFFYLPQEIHAQTASFLTSLKSGQIDVNEVLKILEPLSIKDKALVFQLLLKKNTTNISREYLEALRKITVLLQPISNEKLSIVFEALSLYSKEDQIFLIDFFESLVGEDHCENFLLKSEGFLIFLQTLQGKFCIETKQKLTIAIAMLQEVFLGNRSSLKDKLETIIDLAKKIDSIIEPPSKALLQKHVPSSIGEIHTKGLQEAPEVLLAPDLLTTLECHLLTEECTYHMIGKEAYLARSALPPSPSPMNRKFPSGVALFGEGIEAPPLSEEALNILEKAKKASKDLTGDPAGKYMCSARFYPKGSYIDWHHDFGLPAKSHEIGKPVMRHCTTGILYLNTPEEGGGTSFYNLGEQTPRKTVTVPAEEGKLLFFRSRTCEGVGLTKYLHKADKVEKGHKWVLILSASSTVPGLEDL